MTEDYETMSTKELWLAAPEGQYGDYIRETIQKWDDEPTALQLLETLDMSLWCGDSSEFVNAALFGFLNEAMIKENKTADDMANLAYWRIDATNTRPN